MKFFLLRGMITDHRTDTHVSDTNGLNSRPNTSKTYFSISTRKANYFFIRKIWRGNFFKVIIKQGLCSDSEAPTINEQTIQSVDKATQPNQETIIYLKSFGILSPLTFWNLLEPS